MSMKKQPKDNTPWYTLQTGFYHFTPNSDSDGTSVPVLPTLYSNLVDAADLENHMLCKHTKSDRTDLVWIRNSNMIEGICNLEEDHRCLDSWRWFSQPEVKLTKANVLNLHEQVMIELYPQVAGKVRTCKVWVGPSLKMLPKEVTIQFPKWFKRYGKASTEIEIVEAHVMFEHIHPFVDGNGRVGRMVMNKQFVVAGRPPKMVRYEDRWEYYGLFGYREAFSEVN